MAMFGPQQYNNVLSQIQQGWGPRGVQQRQQEQNQLRQLMAQKVQESQLANRSQELANTQTATNLSQQLKPQNQFKQVQGPDGQTYQVQLGPQGQIVGQPEPIPGLGKKQTVSVPDSLLGYLPENVTPENATAKDLVQAARTKNSQPTAQQQKFEMQQKEDQEKQKLAQQNALETYSTISQKVGEATSIIDENPIAVGGTLGWINSNIGGTDAFRLERAFDTLKAILSFDELQKMRNASKTGGALGAVSERELQLLGSTVSALDSGLPAEDLKRNLAQIQSHYDNFIKSLGVDVPQQQPTGQLEVGTEQDGYRYKGGNPSDPNSWEKL